MSIYKDTAIYTLTSGTSKLLQLLLLPILTFHLSVEEFGNCFFALSLANFAPLLYEGFRTAVHRSFFDKNEDKNAVVTSGFIGQLGLALATAILSYALFHRADYLGLAACAIFFQQLSAFGLDLFRLQMNALVFAGCNVLQGLILVTLTWLNPSPEGYLLALSASHALILPFALTPVRLYWTTQWKSSLIFSLAKFSLPLTISGMGYFLMTNLDRWMIGPSDSLGHYTLAFRITAPLMLLATAFQSSWSPKHLHAFEKGELGREKAANDFLSFWALFGLFSLLVNYLGVIILPYIASPEYGGAAAIIPYLSASFFFYSLSIYCNHWIFIEKRNRFMLVAMWSATCLNAWLNFLLIPQYSGVGAALATLVSNLFLVLISGATSLPWKKGAFIAACYSAGFFLESPIPALFAVLSIKEWRGKLSLNERINIAH